MHGGAQAQQRERAAPRRLGAADLALALLVGATFAASPLTGAARLLPSLAGGAIAAAAFLLWQRRREPPAPLAAEPAPALLWIVLGLALLVLVPTGVALYERFTESVWRNAHGLVLPLVMAGLAVRTLRREGGGPAESSAWGWLPLVVALVLLVLDGGVRSRHLATLAIPLLLLGLSLLLLGPRCTRALALPLALGLFLLPLPTSLTTRFGLQTGSAIGIELLLDAAGVPVLRTATALQMPTNLYAVSANCSGFSAFYAGIAAALVLGVHSRSWLRTALLLLAVWPLAVAANALRTATLIFLCERRGITFLDTPLHGISGILAVGAVLLGLAALAGPRALRETFR